MIVAVGVDFVEIDRIGDLLASSRGDRFVDRVFLPSEQRYCEQRARPAESFAARFAAKEAVMKCLGTGWADGVGFRTIEIVRVDGGAVGVALHGRAADVARMRGIARIHLSFAHGRRDAVAYAVAEG